MTGMDIQPQEFRARELLGDFWFNSEPVPISALRGQVILLEFWDYTCLHCQRILPYIKEWEGKYSPYGLVVVGVHTPKFPFGRSPEQVQKAIERLGIRFPVVMDNEGLIAANYENRSWPTIILIDKNGFVRYRNEGEGNYAATEHALQTLMYDAGVGEELPLLMEPIREEDRTGALHYRATPDLYAGYLRGSIGNTEGYSPESVVDYQDPRLYLEGRFYVEGPWLNDKTSLQFAGGGTHTGQIIIDYQALEVSIVVGPDGEKGVEVSVSQDGRPLGPDNKGDDVRISSDGESHVVVDRPRCYNIIKNKQYGQHTLRLRMTSHGFALYSFMFVSGVIPELISNN
jgi:thiol-disulfide isomerase/thioredoxin